MNGLIDDLIGLELAKGRYSILAQIGAGNMGRVYLARDQNLETEVVIKFPIEGEVQGETPELLERFTRETSSLVRLSHPHVVKIIDVGTYASRPFVVLQYLSGGTLRDRIEYGADGPLPMSPQSLRHWLLDVARALDFIHSQGHIHRDVKPANILFDAHGNAFLGDFGIVKSLGQVLVDQMDASSRTAPGFLLATPNYVAPELVMGEIGDGRSDQYSLAMTIHELLLGRNVMVGPTPSATLVNQTQQRPTSLSSLVSGIGRRLSDALQKGLEKDPEDRYPSCTAFAEAVLAQLPAAPVTKESPARPTSACPLCHRPIQIGPEQLGQSVRCPRCRTRCRVEPDGLGFSLRRIEPNEETSGSSTEGTGLSKDFTEFEVYQTSAHAEPSTPRPLPAPPRSPTGRSKFRQWLLVTLVLLLVGGIGAGFAWWKRDSDGGVERTQREAARPAAVGELSVGINIAYGTEKRRWLESALKDFEKTEAGQRIKVNLIGKGSVEGANMVLNGPGPKPIHVWSPASSAYRSVLERDWTVRHGRSPIIHAQDLALTPMVFVMWRHRQAAFVKKYGAVTFRTIALAMKEPSGWRSIADQPDWGLFKFGHTDPEQSNSGLLTLTLMAYEFAGKQRNLTPGDVTSPEFLSWLATFERGVTRHGGELTHSTGTLMEEMVKRGPSQYDCLIIYESLAIDFMDAARSRWGDLGELSVVYPTPNLWNEHPYYILDVPWSGSAERQAATKFLEFLMTAPIQRRAIDHGFRPGDPSIGLDFPGSPLVTKASRGLSLAVPPMCEPPDADAVTNLLGAFRRLEP